MTKLTELLSEDNFSVSELIMALNLPPWFYMYIFIYSDFFIYV